MFSFAQIGDLFLFFHVKKTTERNFINFVMIGFVETEELEVFVFPAFCQGLIFDLKCIDKLELIIRWL